MLLLGIAVAVDKDIISYKFEPVAFGEPSLDRKT
jgi:hypothetical protein